MSKRVIIIGAVALGPKVACRLRRIDPDAQITLIDRDNLISYGGCGIPYYVGGDVADLEGLYSTIAHAVRDKAFFEMVKGVDVITRAEAISINRKEKSLTIRHLEENREQVLEYDKLVIATGATPVQPPFPGVTLPQVFPVSNLHQAKAIKDMISKGEVENAVIIGAGAIGIEMAEALTDLWGVNTTIVEMADRVLPQALGRNIATIAQKQLTDNGVKLLIGERVLKINGTPETGVESVETTAGTLPCQLVILATGIRPNSELAADAGLALGWNRGILVDQCMRTSDPDIYAGGDCVEVMHLVSGRTLLMPLGSLANRQGRIIASNINGSCEQFKGTVGTFCIKIFDMGFSTAGLTFDQAKDVGFDPVYATVAQSDRAHFYPDSEFMYMELIADRKTRRVLGVEAAGPQGDAVKARVDAIAPLFQYRADISDICTLEAGYSPPYASAMDIINNVANTLDNILDGKYKTIDALDFIKKFEAEEIRVLDVRSKIQADPFVKKYGERWINIPQEKLRERIDEVPKNEDICTICGSGPRSYEAQIVLGAKNITQTYNVQGGYGMIIAVHDPLI
ncbi:MAG: FAD-dependent oxidoreductase [Desulfobacterium sp.]|jgi:NADPH-dependent 2,4-dienoyl-CoA reductase/sulfur reductase-like enzyme/rhodanese-related sulfurtransferase|nr:FAD-dependent oxidoreductase [Desulfobacterium sp.]